MVGCLDSFVSTPLTVSWSPKLSQNPVISISLMLVLLVHASAAVGAGVGWQIQFIDPFRIFGVGLIANRAVQMMWICVRCHPSPVPHLHHVGCGECFYDSVYTIRKKPFNQRIFAQR